MTESTFELPEAQEANLKRVPVRRWGAGEDLAGIAVYSALAAATAS